jgi:phosphoribosylamine--glycine ligase
MVMRQATATAAAQEVREPIHPAAVTTVLAAAGYPERPRTGDVIELPASLPEGVTIFHAGTAADGRPGDVRTAGGRVLDVTALGATLADARARAYEAAGRISWPGMQYRRDIAAVAADATGTAS